AEDGIRDFHVTGVQTCALPILTMPLDTTLVFITSSREGATGDHSIFYSRRNPSGWTVPALAAVINNEHSNGAASITPGGEALYQIGRASCRDSGEVPAAAVPVQ